MSIAIVVLCSVLGLALVGLLVWLFLIVFKKSEEPENENIILNFMPQFAYPNSGFALGSEISTTKVDNRFMIEYKPRDLDNKKEVEIKDIEPVKVVIDQNKVLDLSKGILSANRNIKILLPPNPEDFPDRFKETRFGQAMIKLTEDINAENAVTFAQRNRIKVENKLLNKNDGGERMQEYLTADEEFNQELHKKLIDKVPDKNSNFKLNPQGGQ